MRKAAVFVNGVRAATLEEQKQGEAYLLRYDERYDGPPVSLTMPLTSREYYFSGFPAFFDGLLPEGVMLDALLRNKKIDQKDLFSQLVAVGADLVGAVTVEEERSSE